MSTRGSWVMVTCASLFICSTVVLLAAFSEELQHWFIIPVMLCGIIAGADALRWLSGKQDLLDASGLFGLFGVHYFFIAPIFQVTSQHRMLYIVNQPEDWRPWVGLMASLNCIGLLIYKFVAKYMERHTKATATEWVVNPDRVRVLANAGLLVALTLQVFVYWRFGGISGYMAAFSEGSGAFEGYGYTFLISESGPLLAVTAACLLNRRRPGWLKIAIGLVGLLCAQLLSGGLRGSRSNTVFVLVIAVGMLHGTVRRFPRLTVACGAVILGIFILGDHPKPAINDHLKTGQR